MVRACAKPFHLRDKAIRIAVLLVAGGAWLGTKTRDILRTNL